MTLFSDTLISASYVGPTTTIADSCFDRDLSQKEITKRYTFSEDRAGQTLKKAAAVSLASTVTSSLHNCQANQVIRNAQMYVESLNEDQLYELVHMLEEKEESLSTGEIICEVSQVEESQTKGKVFEKKI